MTSAFESMNWMTLKLLLTWRDRLFDDSTDKIQRLRSCW
ncbi:hypothetical protein SynMITS9220_02889 [Synechococcus sp. MIT S9220]|nr:hypothetical protein SynMITS9220_02889 [Synechococcus sp. MIT S9220]